MKDGHLYREAIKNVRKEVFLEAMEHDGILKQFIEYLSKKDDKDLIKEINKEVFNISVTKYKESPKSFSERQDVRLRLDFDTLERYIKKGEAKRNNFDWLVKEIYDDMGEFILERIGVNEYNEEEEKKIIKLFIEEVLIKNRWKGIRYLGEYNKKEGYIKSLMGEDIGLKEIIYKDTLKKISIGKSQIDSNVISDFLVGYIRSKAVSSSTRLSKVEECLEIAKTISKYNKFRETLIVEELANIKNSEIARELVKLFEVESYTFTTGRDKKILFNILNRMTNEDIKNTLNKSSNVNIITLASKLNKEKFGDEVFETIYRKIKESTYDEKFKSMVLSNLPTKYRCLESL